MPGRTVLFYAQREEISTGTAINFIRNEVSRRFRRFTQISEKKKKWEEARAFVSLSCSEICVNLRNLRLTQVLRPRINRVRATVAQIEMRLDLTHHRAMPPAARATGVSRRLEEHG
jgi:hypothetical protein